METLFMIAAPIVIGLIIYCVIQSIKIAALHRECAALQSATHMAVNNANREAEKVNNLITLFSNIALDMSDEEIERRFQLNMDYVSQAISQAVSQGSESVDDVVRIAREIKSNGSVPVSV